MQKLLQIVKKARSFFNISSIDYFVRSQNQIYSNQQILKSFIQIANTLRYSQQKCIKTIIPNLHRILYYLCNKNLFDQQIQKFIQENQFNIINSTLEVLKIYSEYLKTLLPTNITYFHFLRQSDLYMHYIVVRYVLIAGNSAHLRKLSKYNIFEIVSPETRKTVFAFLVEWLQSLVDYRSSAIYVQSTTLSYLISSSFILVCGLLGKSYQNTFNLYAKNEKKKLFNDLMMISIYILCDTTKNGKREKYFLISLAITCLRKMLLGLQVPQIDTFIPSYLYADMIGFIHCPLIYQTISRVLISFLNDGFERELKIKKMKQKQIVQKSNSEEGSQLGQDDDDLFFVSPLTEINIWNVINLIIAEYGTYNPRFIQAFITKIIPEIKPQSLVRAYCIKLIERLSLQNHNKVIQQFYLSQKYGYKLQNKILSVDLAVKNFSKFMEAIYLNSVQQAVYEKEVVLGNKNIFRYLFEIKSQQIYQIPVHEQKDGIEKQKNKNQDLKQQEQKQRSAIQQNNDINHDNKFESNQDDRTPLKQNNVINSHQLEESAYYEKRTGSKIYKNMKDTKQRQQMNINDDDNADENVKISQQ